MQNGDVTFPEIYAFRLLWQHAATNLAIVCFVTYCKEMLPHKRSCAFNARPLFKLAESGVETKFESANEQNPVRRKNYKARLADYSRQNWSMTRQRFPAPQHASALVLSSCRCFTKKTATTFSFCTITKFYLRITKSVRAWRNCKLAHNFSILLGNSALCVI